MMYRRNIALLEAELGPELVALAPEDGVCFGFNAVAASVWKLLERPRSFDEIKAGLLAEYEVGDEQCGNELRVLLADLQQRKLVRMDPR
ncbi:PqqD family protein [Sphingomonas ginkgonis]|uniref:PqqD family protein n=1 Tax=Sphingomonas ginkgonis TaxID=2315330 RepID=A0A3R9YM16_9SPHN|nr:PqqD family protein [Sphingomonas ginkgonis]RST30806.1 PqqD family protein [Sphingomonas ginkgonis]